MYKVRGPLRARIRFAYPLRASIRFARIHPGCARNRSGCARMGGRRNCRRDLGINIGAAVCAPLGAYSTCFYFDWACPPPAHGGHARAYSYLQSWRVAPNTISHPPSVVGSVRSPFQILISVKLHLFGSPLNTRHPVYSVAHGALLIAAPYDSVRAGAALLLLQSTVAAFAAARVTVHPSATPASTSNASSMPSVCRATESRCLSTAIPNSAKTDAKHAHYVVVADLDVFGQLAAHEYDARQWHADSRENNRLVRDSTLHDIRRIGRQLVVTARQRHCAISAGPKVVHREGFHLANSGVWRL